MAQVPIFEEANRLNEAGEFDKALELYDQVLTQNHNHPELLATMATIYLRNPKTMGLSVSMFEHSISRLKEVGKPIPSEVLSNLGLSYKYSGQLAKAETYMKAAVDAAPTAGVLTNYGSLFVETDNPEKGVEYLERAVKEDPAMALAHWNLALCLLGQCNESGEWGRAWDEYEWGQHDGGMRVKKKLVPLPDWDGAKGKKVMVYGEQGIGDEIMFASMLPDMMKDAEVILDCHPRLTTLFEKSFNVKCYGTRKQAEVDWVETEKPDAILSMGSLGKFYRRKPADFPGTQYLKAEPLERSAESKKKFRVGISWTGGRLTQRVARRTVPLNWWRNILATPGCEFVSLQYTGGSEEEVASVRKLGYEIAEPPEAKANDYYETARLVASCDLVITVCTSVVHLAGALGVPCWVMVPKHPAWRYQRSGRMPWYRSVRLYRQPEDNFDAWLAVVNRVTGDLNNLMDEQRKVIIPFASNPGKRILVTPTAPFVRVA